MSDYYSIQEVGGAELARHYPDRGQLPESDVHRAILSAGTKASGWRRLFRKHENFLAVLSANGDGLRLLVSLDGFAVFIPWSELTVAAERATPGTTVRLQTTAVASLELELHLDDVSADVLFAKAMAPLPQRYPPGRLYWPRPGSVLALVALTLVLAIAIFFLDLSWQMRLAVNLVTAIGIALVWFACRPILEEG